MNREGHWNVIPAWSRPNGSFCHPVEINLPLSHHRDAAA
jgi:hypothetical protein